MYLQLLMSVGRLTARLLVGDKLHQCQGCGQPGCAQLERSIVVHGRQQAAGVHSLPRVLGAAATGLRHLQAGVPAAPGWAVLLPGAPWPLPFLQLLQQA